MIDITGHKYHRLTVLSHSHSVGHQHYWRCVCDCGKSGTWSANTLRAGNTKSCGCFRNDAIAAVMGTHGMKQTKAYKSWCSMKSRCVNPKNPNFSDYGERGIAVCDRWMSFENFYKDMGEREAGYSIDGIDNNKGYSPENCKWSNFTEQSRNRRVTLKWNGKPLAQIAEEHGANYETLYYRLKKYGTPFPKHLEKNDA